MYDGLNFAHGAEWATQVAAEMAELAAERRGELDRATAAGCFPREIYLEMGRRGWVGPTTGREHGGLGGGIAEYCLVCEEVARHGLVSPQISVQGQQWLARWGTTEQRERWLPGIAGGRVVFSESISEPGAASSLRALRTTATPCADGWRLNGHKTHVNLGHQSDVTLVYADAADAGLTAFLVDTTTPGLRTVQTEPIGIRMLPTADVFLEDVVVPTAAVLGEVGGGLATFLTTFNVSRLGNASELIGFGRRGLAEAVDYGRQRAIGGSVVTDFQGIRWIVAERYAQLYAAAAARNQAALRADAGGDVGLATSMAKVLAVHAAETAVNDAFALVGSHGLYSDRSALPQLMHDVKVYRIAGGSVEVLRNYLAKRVLADDVDAAL